MLIKLERVTQFNNVNDGTVLGASTKTIVMYINPIDITWIEPYRYWSTQVEDFAQIRINGNTFQIKATPEQVVDMINMAEAKVPKNFKIAAGGL
jgi:hypothetical protein